MEGWEEGGRVGREWVSFHHSQWGWMPIQRDQTQMRSVEPANSHQLQRAGAQRMGGAVGRALMPFGRCGAGAAAGVCGVLLRGQSYGRVATLAQLLTTWFDIVPSPPPSTCD